MYLINVGEADKMRAASLNLIFDRYSVNFFPFDEIKNGDKVLFAGCGNGQLVVEIAREMKNRKLDVEIVAFDISQPQLDCAEKYAAQQGVNNVSWKLQNVFSLEEFKGQFNVVHARFLLNHLKDAKKAAELLCDTLAANGIFIGEEFASDEVDVYPETNHEYSQAIQEWVNGVRRQHELQKSDMAFAKKLPDILRNKNMTVLQEVTPGPMAFNQEEKNIFPECMASAHRIFPQDQHYKIPLIKSALENVRDAPECSVRFKHFTQIKAKNIS